MIVCEIFVKKCKSWHRDCRGAVRRSGTKWRNEAKSETPKSPTAVYCRMPHMLKNPYLVNRIINCYNNSHAK